MHDAEIRNLAERLVRELAARSSRIATAESCTGGLVSGAITEIAGSSAVFEQGFVTYSNEAKTNLLGVSADMLTEHGAVSPEVARAMAEGVLGRTGADLALAVTGIAGPGGGSARKPIGLVYFGVASRLGVRSLVCRFGSLDRREVRSRSVLTALQLATQELARLDR